MDKHARVLISCGPIPARLDSVKFITNRFKGGLAFETAKRLQNLGHDVTVIKWKHTSMPKDIEPTDVIDVLDVVDYYNKILDRVNSYDAFVLAAAVANLMPSNPYEGKFPSHNYKVGEKFDIAFEIAPRIIDEIKKHNPRCCLIGYKLFDSDTEEELIEIGKHTLKDSKANVIFANTPSTAKTRKIALTQDNSVIPMSFDEHIDFIDKAITSEFFKTTISGKNLSLDTQDEIGMLLVRVFENSFSGYGTVGIKTPHGMATTSRGHKASNGVIVTDVDFDNKQITSSEKATLNAPTLWAMLQHKETGTGLGSYVVHRHFDDDKASKEHKNWNTIGYEFPGTLSEVESVKHYRNVNIQGHGYLETKEILPVDWKRYYELFPSKYFSKLNEDILNLINKYCGKDTDFETLEIGGNTSTTCKYNLDPNIPDLPNNLTYEQLKGMRGKFDFIVCRNSISYLTIKEIEIAMEVLKPGGVMVANTFMSPPREYKITENELAFRHGDEIIHYLIVDDQIYEHRFFARKAIEYQAMGFNAQLYGPTSVLLTYTKEYQ